MNRKTVVVILASVAIVVVAVSVAAILINHGKASAKEEYLQDASELKEFGAATDTGIIRLTCLTDSQQEAEQIAQSYGIEFVSFEYGVAVFISDKPYHELIAYGEENNLKQLSIDYEQTIFNNSDTKEYK